MKFPGEAGKEGKCGKLHKWLYGMRNAASAWEKHYSDTLAEMGFIKSKVAPTVFYHVEKKVRCVVHGDDFTFSGRLKMLKEIAEQMKSIYELKVRGILGDGPDDDEEITILNRTLRWTAEGLEYRADDKHVREITKYFGLTENSKGARVRKGVPSGSKEISGRRIRSEDHRTGRIRPPKTMVPASSWSL